MERRADTVPGSADSAGVDPRVGAARIIASISVAAGPCFVFGFVQGAEWADAVRRAPEGEFGDGMCWMCHGLGTAAGVVCLGCVLISLWTTPRAAQEKYGTPEVQGDHALIITFDGPVDISASQTIPSDHLEAEGITGIADPADAATRLRELGVTFAVVTDGPSGAWVNHDDFVGHIPAFKVDTIDTTGAGDSFTAGVLIHGLGAEDAARLGAAMGALCTTTIGTFTGPDDPADAWRLAGLEPPR